MKVWQEKSLENLANFAKFYSPNILQFNYYYQYFNIFTKPYFAKFIFMFLPN